MPLKEVNEYLKEVFARRGEIINQSIQLEYAIDIFISNIFCANDKKQKHFLEFVLWKSQIGFTKKLEILSKLIPIYEKGILVDYPTLLNDIREIIKARNIMAHSHLDTLGGGGLFKTAKSKIAYLKKNNVGQHVEYDEKKTKHLIELINLCTNCLTYWHGLPPLISQIDAPHQNSRTRG